MSRRIQQFTPLREDKTGVTYHLNTLAREKLSRTDPERQREPNLKWDYDRTLQAITTGQRFPMKQAKAERIATRLVGSR